MVRKMQKIEDRGSVPSAALADFGAPPVVDRMKAQRERYARETADRAARLARPLKDEATANVADSHVARVVVDGRRLRFGYGIERQVAKSYLPVAALRACERFRLDWEAANIGGAIAVINPMRVRVDSSVRNWENPGGRVDAPRAFRAACAAIGLDGSVEVFVAVHCVCEGKLLKDAAGVTKIVQVICWIDTLEEI
jgi:hypothetical protein